MNKILPSLLLLLSCWGPAKADDAQDFKARLSKALSSWTADRPGEGRLSYAEPLEVKADGNGGYLVRVSELAWLAPVSGSSRATIDFGPSEIRMTPAQGGWVVSGQVSDLVRFVANGEVRAAAKLTRNRFEGLWDDKREAFTKLKAEINGLGIEFASGDNLVAGQIRLTAQSPEDSFQGQIDIADFQGYRAQDRTNLKIDQARIDLAQKPTRGNGKLNFAWRHQSPAPTAPGAPQEVNPIRLNLKGDITPFDWRHALGQLAPAAADGENPFGKSLWTRIEPSLHKINAKLTLADGRVQSVHLSAKVVGEARFPPNAPTTGSFNAKLQGVQERMQGLGKGGSAGMLSSIAVLGVLSATGIPDGKKGLDYKIDIAPDGQVLLNGQKAGGLLPKL